MVPRCGLLIWVSVGVFCPEGPVGTSDLNLRLSTPDQLPEHVTGPRRTSPVHIQALNIGFPYLLGTKCFRTNSGILSARETIFSTYFYDVGLI